jgi:tol-pal system protein YbgF
MLKSNLLRNRLFAMAVIAMVLACSPRPAHAASKEIIELQTQVQQLLDAMQRLQSTMDTKFGVMQHLVEQTADNTNQMSVAVNTLQQKINAQTEAGGGKLDTVSGQVQSLNDSVDELKSRIAKLDKSVEDLKGQLQNIQSTGGGAAPMAQTPAQPPPGNAQQSAPDATTPAPDVQTSTQAPPLAETFQAGLRDYNAARYDVAAGEFQDVLHFYPMDELAGQAQFYLGEIAYRQLNYTEAVKAFNAVLEAFPGSPKAPAAQLRKGFALLQMNKKDAGVNELRQLIKRHPQTPEAAQARTKLNGMGVRINPVTPGPR